MTQKRCQYSILHPANIIWMGTHRRTIVLRHFPKPRPPSVTPAFFPDAANLRSADALRDMVDALLLLQLHVSIHSKAWQVVEGSGATIGEHGGVTEASFRWSPPQLLWCSHLHTAGRPLVVLVARSRTVVTSCNSSVSASLSLSLRSRVNAEL